MSVITPSKHSAFVESISAHAPTNFAEIREHGNAKLATVEFPTLRSEVWKYTRISGILNKTFTPNTTASARIPQHLLNLVGSHPYLVFVNGFYAAELSQIAPIEGVSISTLSADEVSAAQLSSFPTSWDSENEAFTHLNEATFTDGVLIKVDKNIEVDHPIYFINLVDGKQSAAAKRNYVQLDSGAKATFINLYESDENISFSNHFTALTVAENAHLHWFDYHNEQQNANQIHTTIANQAADSHLNMGSYIFGGKLIRKNFYVNVQGSNAETTINGTYLLNNKQVADHRIIIDHQAPHCNSNQTFKGVMSDKSTGVFNGKIYVRRDAQIINAFQSNRNILLSDDANAYSRPQLEIYADDVKCSHGSTIGQLDQEALFYLMARGIRREEAEKLLVGAFTADALENIDNEPFKEFIIDALAQKTTEL